MDACCCPKFEKTCMVFLKVDGGVLILINEQCFTITHLNELSDRMMRNVMSQLHKGGDRMTWNR